MSLFTAVIVRMYASGCKDEAQETPWWFVGIPELLA